MLGIKTRAKRAVLVGLCFLAVPFLYLRRCDVAAGPKEYRHVQEERSAAAQSSNAELDQLQHLLDWSAQISSALLDKTLSQASVLEFCAYVLASHPFNPSAKGSEILLFQDSELGSISLLNAGVAPHAPGGDFVITSHMLTQPAFSPFRAKSAWLAIHILLNEDNTIRTFLVDLDSQPALSTQGFHESLSKKGVVPRGAFLRIEQASAQWQSVTICARTNSDGLPIFESFITEPIPYDAHIDPGATPIIEQVITEMKACFEGQPMTSQTQER